MNDLGTAKFCKAELNVQQHYTIGPPIMDQPGLIASICGSLGALYPLFSNNTTSSSSDSDKNTVTTHIKHGNTFLSDRFVSSITSSICFNEEI